MEETEEVKGRRWIDNNMVKHNKVKSRERKRTRSEVRVEGSGRTRRQGNPDRNNVGMLEIRRNRT